MEILTSPIFHFRKLLLRLLRAGATPPSEFFRKSWMALLCLLLITVLHLITATCAQASENEPVFSETSVKAAFIFNMARFMTWPIQHEPCTILILGDHDLAATLRQMTDGEENTAFIISEEFSPSEQFYHMVFTSRNIPIDTPKKLYGPNMAHALLITDHNKIEKYGHMIYLSKKESRLHLQINISQTKNSGIYISPQLLNISEIITSNHPGSRS